MTKDEYLNELKTKLTDLTDSQINETIQYYSDYFDDAKDDEKLFKELGSTDELAATVLNKYKNQIKEKTENKQTVNEDIDSKALYFSYKASEVKNLIISLGAANVVMIPGKVISVETRGIDKECFFCNLSSEGTLAISNNKRVNFNFWSHDRKYRAVPRILITVPENASFNKLKINVGTGNFSAKNTIVSCTSGSLEVGAGNLNAGKILGGSIDARCGMGNLEMSGTISGVSNIDCGMGCIKLNLTGNESDYSYEAKVGLGEVMVNNHKKGGFGQDASEEKKENNFSINCGLGSVIIKIN